MVGRRPLVFAWDIEGQWAERKGWTPIRGKAQLLAAAQRKRGRFAYQPGPDLADEFGYFSRVLLAAGRRSGGFDVVAEELADVTHAGKAGGHWGMLVRRILKRGVSLYCITQRPAEIDKTTVGNATDWIVFRLSRVQDRKYAAAETGVDLAELAALQPLDHFAVDLATGAAQKGRVTFKK